MLDWPLLTRAASKLNENLYASTALEKGTGKIKTLQITHLPLQQANEEKAARAIAINYMAALMRQFEPALTVEQSTHRGRKHYQGEQPAGKRQRIALLPTAGRRHSLCRLGQRR